MKDLAIHIPLQQVEMGHDARQHKQVLLFHPRGGGEGTHDKLISQYSMVGMLKV